MSSESLILTFPNEDRSRGSPAPERFSTSWRSAFASRCRSLNLVRSWHSPRALWILKSWHMEARSERKEHRLTLPLSRLSISSPFQYCPAPARSALRDRNLSKVCWNPRTYNLRAITIRWSRRTHFVTFHDIFSFGLRSSLEVFRTYLTAILMQFVFYRT